MNAINIHWTFFLVPFILGTLVASWRFQSFFDYIKKEKVKKQMHNLDCEWVTVPMFTTWATRLLDLALRLLIIYGLVACIMLVIMVSMQLTPFDYGFAFFVIKTWFGVLGLTVLIRYSFWPVVHPRPDRGDPTVSYQVVGF